MGASISSSEYEEEYMREPLLNESFNSNSPTPIRFYSSEDDEHQYMRMSKLSFFN
jgi:hypothetical protein